MYTDIYNLVISRLVEQHTDPMNRMENEIYDIQILLALLMQELHDQKVIDAEKFINNEMPPF